jgi:arsenate reductase
VASEGLGSLLLAALIAHMMFELPALQLIDQMLAYPILINRPIVVTPWGVKRCRPLELVLDILQIP